MDSDLKSKYRIVTVSGKIASGTTTLATNLSHILKWEHVNVGWLQRKFDRENNIDEHKQGAQSRSDEHERLMDESTKKVLATESKIVYEAWLSGFVAQSISGVLKVLVICSHEDLRIDRIVNRENISVEEAKHLIKQREEENITKWKKLYGDYDFWDPKYYDIVIDTYSCGPMETMGKVLDELGYHGKLHK